MTSNLETAIRSSILHSGTPKRRKIKAENLYIGEIMETAESLIMGKHKMQAGENVDIIVTSPSQSAKKKSIPIARLRYQSSDFARLCFRAASFISILLDLKVAQVFGEILYIGDNLKIREEIFVNIKVYLVPSAFLQSPLGENDQLVAATIRRRKIALTDLFERTGLLESKTSVAVKAEEPEPNAVVELSASDISAIYGKTHGNKLVPMKPADGMLLTLRDYQEVGLAFLYAKETSNLTDLSLSPIWKEMKTLTDVFYFNPYSGELKFEFPSEANCQGGILADEMGLGKTIQMLALIHSNRLDCEKLAKNQSRSTLLVCPVNLIAQWRDEAHRAFKDGLVTAETYYGNTRGSTANFCSKKSPTIIITSYGTLASDFGNEESPLYTTNWHRIVLDESHLIKEKSTANAKACFGLSATYRWALSGTPVVNLLDDLFAIVKFLRVEPWCSYSFWHSFITQPFQQHNPNAIDIVQTILEPLILRRTKEQQDQFGNPLITLPVKTIEIKYLDFTVDEREIYDSIAKLSKESLKELQQRGKADYIHVFSLILRMRQVCDHVLLLKTKEEGQSIIQLGIREILEKYHGGGKERSQFSDLLVKEIQTKSVECPLCCETNSSNCLYPCLHSVCKLCFQDLLARATARGLDNACPTCLQKCSEEDVLQIIVKQEDDSEQIRVEDISVSPVLFKPSTKIRALLKSLIALRSSNSGEKVIIFSQWTSMLDLCEISLGEEDFSFVRLDGTLNQVKREKVLKIFKGDPSVKILLASLRSTGVGLNLSVANHVYMMDAWWNESVENQAIDRVHRLGQLKDVFVTRYIIRDSIEEKMLAIQHRKSKLIGALGNADGSKVDLDTLLALFDI